MRITLALLGQGRSTHDSSGKHVGGFITSERWAWNNYWRRVGQLRSGWMIAEHALQGLIGEDSGISDTDHFTKACSAIIGGGI